MNGSEVGDQHGSSLIKGKGVRNAHADSCQSSGVCRERVFPAETNHSVANLKVVRANIRSNAGNYTSGFNSEQANRKLNDTECDQNILELVC